MQPFPPQAKTNCVSVRYINSGAYILEGLWQKFTPTLAMN